ncbi:MAG: hypothetical protein IPK53_07865 [bacterium]|nr:hypothetical protein [bacterium]
MITLPQPIWIFYEVQYQLNCAGSWIDWFGPDNWEGATFTGEVGQSYCFRSRASDLVGNTEAWPESADAQTRVTRFSDVYLPLVVNNAGTPVPPPPPTTVANPGFENGPTDWSWYSTHGWDLITTTFPGGVTPRNGTWAVWLGGGNDEVSYIEQQVTISNSAPYLAYWHWIASEDICGYDFGGVLVNGTGIDVYDLCSSSSTGGWVHHVVNLSAYVGQTISLQIRSETDASLNSNLFVDDVSFQATATSLLNRVVVPDYSAAATDSR